MIKMNFEDWDGIYNCEDNIGYNPSTDAETIKKIINKQPNTIWTLITFDNGELHYINKYDPKGIKCYFSDISYSPDKEIIVDM
jgi:hypothetical protein